jgi:hypothetical protein
MNLRPPQQKQRKTELDTFAGNIYDLKDQETWKEMFLLHCEIQ